MTRRPTRINAGGLNIPELSKAAASGIIIENLLRYRQYDWRAIVAALRQQLAVNYQAATYLARIMHDA
jgi:hypothetical protein